MTTADEKCIRSGQDLKEKAHLDLIDHLCSFILSENIGDMAKFDNERATLFFPASSSFATMISSDREHVLGGSLPLSEAGILRLSDHFSEIAGGISF